MFLSSYRRGWILPKKLKNRFTVSSLNLSCGGVWLLPPSLNKRGFGRRSEGPKDGWEFKWGCLAGISTSSSRLCILSLLLKYLAMLWIQKKKMSFPWENIAWGAFAPCKPTLSLLPCDAEMGDLLPVGGWDLKLKGDWEGLSKIVRCSKVLWTRRLFRRPNRGTGMINGSSSIRANARWFPKLYFKVC